MTEEEKKLEDEALEYIKTHKKELIERFCPTEVCHSVSKPVSLFMAGSPGAGKTEVSKGLMKRFIKDAPVRIDADEIRAFCPGYTGDNAHVFQRAANKGVNFLYDHALSNDINCIMDGTFAYGGVEDNIRRSLKRGRRVEVWFVYQDPRHAWEFTKARELEEARHVSKDVFVRAFFDSRENVKSVKRKLGDAIKINVLIKDYETGTEKLKLNGSVADIDRLADGRYSVDDLNTLLI
ncbi:MAG: zeta toxin family protein [Candidatus Pacebacteria bacterium]|nr:zeta toxin family protein [Candidatus Paceibacterota bacterium]